MSIVGPLNWNTVTLAHAKTEGSFSPSMTYGANNSAYTPRWDYGGGTFDSGLTPAARTQASVPASTSITISYCSFAQADVNVSGCRLTNAGVAALLLHLRNANPGQINYSTQKLYCEADNLASAAVLTFWSDLQGRGWTRTGTYIASRIKFTIQTTAANETFVCPFSNATCVADVDWGDGTATTDSIVNGNTDVRKTHTYVTAATNQVTVVGHDLTTFGFAGAGDRLKVRGIQELLALTVVNQGFRGCSSATGSIPLLSEGLTDGFAMFRDCFALTGPVPSLPTTLINGHTMFATCVGLTGGIPSLPIGLTNVLGMFSNCTGLSGGIPPLPPALVNAQSIVANCTGLTGTIPALPSTITNGTNMFTGCVGLVGPVPALPGSLIQGNAMFFNCSGLTGSVNGLPASLTTASYMFGGTGLTGVQNLSGGSGLTTASYMFSGCTNITGFTHGLVVVVDFTEFVENCTSLDAADIDAWLIWLDTNSTASGLRILTYYSLADNVRLDANRSPAALTAKNSLISKGWVISS